MAASPGGVKLPSEEECRYGEAGLITGKSLSQPNVQLGLKAKYDFNHIIVDIFFIALHGVLNKSLVHCLTIRI
jgi:hypothetical protein